MIRSQYTPKAVSRKAWRICVELKEATTLSEHRRLDNEAQMNDRNQDIATATEGSASVLSPIPPEKGFHE